MSKLFILVCVVAYVNAEFTTRCDDECCQFIGTNNIKTTECAYNKLTQAPQNVSPETQVLSMKGNSIKTFPNGYFDKFTDLRELTISYNELESVDASLFDKLTKLTFLDIHDNEELTQIPAGLFSKNKELVTLKLAELKIDSLPSGLFDGLDKLKALYLDGSQVDASNPLVCSCAMVDKASLLKAACTSMSEESCKFKSSQDVIESVPASYVCPTKCRCSKVNSKIVADCSSQNLKAVPAQIPITTQKLYLNHNDISDVAVDAFKDLVNLEELSLRGNKLPSIRAGAFNGLTNLKKLYVNYNQIPTIPAEAFKELSKLEYLDLHGMSELHVLDENAFVGLASLKTLDMHNTDVISLPEKVFAPLTSLKKMRWEGNHHLACTCSLIEKFGLMDMPGSYGKCWFNGKEKHLKNWGNEAIPEPCQTLVGACPPVQNYLKILKELMKN